ncbi:Metallo-dependent phosphatase [Lyophyllum atratum]|nr:Metallo-dependent phosphatase [Lyophyllum atratum]
MKLSSALVVLFATGAWTIAVCPTAKERANLDPYAGKRRLTFRPDGIFKVTVFSDLQLWREPLGVDADYAVINGDLITGENTFASNSTKLVDQIVQPLINADIPFATTQGLYRAAPAGVGGEGGPGYYWVPVSISKFNENALDISDSKVYKNKLDKASVLILWFFDSRGGFSAGADHHGISDLVNATGAGWIETETEAMNAAWGPADKRGAVAFVHIPPNVVRNLPVDLEINPGLNDDILGDGSVQGAEETPFWDALNEHVKNLHAVISGHDHGNEWCVREPCKRVIFCFDKHPG